MKIAFFGSSLVSAYWNGAATYYRGIIKALNNLGSSITFFEPDAYDRQKHRDIADPEWAEVIVYPAEEDAVYECLSKTDKYDVLIKASGVGIFDELLEASVLNIRKPDQLIVFWDVDAPATLERIKMNPGDQFNKLIPQYDLILTYGGGDPVCKEYISNGAQKCIPVYNALDPSTHFPVPPEDEYKCNLAFLGNRLPDREKRVENFFINPAYQLPYKKFILGGNGWHDKELSSNVKYAGHVFTKDHNAFNSSPDAVLNISRESMANYGYSPATRVFEAAGAGACIITDYWEGIDYFFEPGKEILIAKDGDEVKDILIDLKKSFSKEIGNAAYKRVIADHTYTERANKLNLILNETLGITGKV
jgi:spore maturation protein CgeB